MNIQEQLKKNVETFWACATLNVETFQKAANLAQQVSVEQLNKNFEVATKMQNVKDIPACQSVLAEIGQEVQSAFEKNAKKCTDLVQNYSQSLQKEAEAFVSNCQATVAAAQTATAKAAK